MDGVFVKIYDKGYIGRGANNGWCICEDIDSAHCFEDVTAGQSIVENFLHLSREAFGFVPGVNRDFVLQYNGSYLLCYDMGTVHTTESIDAAMTWDNKQRAGMYANAINSVSCGRFKFEVLKK